jgi:hypothetical protein
VVPGLGRLTENCIVAIGFRRLHYLFQSHFGIGFAGGKLVELVEIALVMLAVVQTDGSRGNLRRKRIGRIGKR